MAYRMDRVRSAFDRGAGAAVADSAGPAPLSPARGRVRLRQPAPRAVRRTPGIRPARCGEQVGQPSHAGSALPGAGDFADM